MENPYNSRFLRAMEHLHDQGAFASQRQFCEVLGFHPNYIAGFRQGTRNVQPEHISNLFTKYHVSVHYLLTGKGPIMEKEREDGELENQLKRERERMALLSRLLEAKDEIIQAKEQEVAFYRDLLKKFQPPNGS